MSQIEIGPDLVQIDAGIVAKALKLEPQELQDRMRNGTVTSRFERGEGEDAGRVRLTFFSDTRRARITADTSGAVLFCSAVDFSQPSFMPRVAASTTARTAAPVDSMLDAALEGTFPASDPVALSFDAKRK